MTGIEKITGRIGDDCQQEVDAILSEARAQAGEITARYAEEAKKLLASELAKGEAAAAQRRERVQSSVRMEEKKMVLAAKQEMLDKTFQRALEKLNTLPEADYIDLLANLAVRASVTGREQLVFSARDRSRYGVKVATKANTALEQAGKIGALTLSEQSGTFQGGLLVCDGEVEVNCTFETLVRLARGEMSAQVIQTLFD